MSVIRNRKQNHYVAIDNNVVCDKRLSWGARGLLCYLLSKPADWRVQIDDLIRQSPLGRDGVRKLMSELQKCGYLVKSRIREEGKFTGICWDVYESPQTEIPVMAPQPEKPAPVNPIHTNKDKTQKKEDIYINNPKFMEAKARYPKRPGSSWQTAWKAWQARLKQGCTADEMLKGTIAYKKYCDETDKTGTEYVKMPATFYGPDLHFRADWTPPKKKQAENIEALAAIHARPGESMKEFEIRWTRESRSA